MMSVAIWLVSRRSQLTHALLVFAELGAKNVTPQRMRGMQCALGFACSTAENVTSRALETPQKNLSRGCAPDTSALRIFDTKRVFG
jgi:hypothetical protein